jgi:DNA-binding NarL/FixJ family response regulator
MITLLLADDHRIMRQGLGAILGTVPGFRLLGEAGDGPDTLRQMERHQPDVLVLDLMLPNLNGIGVAREVARRWPRTRIVILTMHANEAYVVEALAVGATAYVLKEAGADELVEAIRQAAAGRRYLSPSISEGALGAYRRMAEGTSLAPHQTLTLREREVMQLTAEGHSAVEIAERLYISRRTVETHRGNVMRKLGVRNQKELTRYAVERGVVLKNDEPMAGGNAPAAGPR